MHFGFLNTYPLVNDLSVDSTIQCWNYWNLLLTVSKCFYWLLLLFCSQIFDMALAPVLLQLVAENPSPRHLLELKKLFT